MKKRVLLTAMVCSFVLGGCGTGTTGITTPKNKHNLTISKCKNLYSDYTQSQWANEIGYGENKPLTSACYQALIAGPRLGIDGQMYIDAYNQGTYDLIEGAMNHENTNTEEDMRAIKSMGFEKCNKIFSELDSQEMYHWANLMTQEALKNDISEEDRYDYKMSAAMIVHCRQVLYGE